MPALEGVEELLRSVKYAIVPYTRGTGIDIGIGNFMLQIGCIEIKALAACKRCAAFDHNRPHTANPFDVCSRN